MAKKNSSLTAGKNRKGTIRMDFQKNKAVYFMFLPVVIFYLVFHYYPMSGIILAFKDFKPALGIWGSPFTGDFGFEHFIAFFGSSHFARTITNTILISFYQLIFGFPMPILLAIMLNELHNRRFKKVMQTVTYFPHFISTVVVCGMLTEFCLSDGLFNQISGFLEQNLYPCYQNRKCSGLFMWPVASGSPWVGTALFIWAAIAGIDTQLYEAASLDGAGRFRKIWHITLPGIKGTVVILFIMAVGKIMSVGSEKILLLYNPSTYKTADVISTYVYRKGLLDQDYSYSTAVNLFNSVINFALVFFANTLSRKLTETSLF